MVEVGWGYHGVQPGPTDGSCGKERVGRGRVGMGPGGAARVAEVAIAVDMFWCL